MNSIQVKTDSGQGLVPSAITWVNVDTEDFAMTLLLHTDCIYFFYIQYTRFFINTYTKNIQYV